MGVVNMSWAHSNATLSGKNHGNGCAVGCSNRCFRDYGLEIYRFPQDSERRRQWIAAIDKKTGIYQASSHGYAATTM